VNASSATDIEEATQDRIAEVLVAPSGAQAHITIVSRLHKPE